MFPLNMVISQSYVNVYQWVILRPQPSHSKLPMAPADLKDPRHRPFPAGQWHTRPGARRNPTWPGHGGHRVEQKEQHGITWIYSIWIWIYYTYYDTWNMNVYDIHMILGTLRLLVSHPSNIQVTSNTSVFSSKYIDAIVRKWKESWVVPRWE